MPAMIIPERLAEFESLRLNRGAHDAFTDGHCAMEAVAWLTGEPHSDHPKCVSPVLASFLRAWNDALADDGRQSLKPYLPRVVGTAGDGLDEQRAWLATDWLVRVCTPAWLELAGVKDAPAALRALPPITADTVTEAQPTITDARKAGAAAGAAARDATWAAAGAAAGDAAGAAAGEAAGDAAWDATWDAAGAAAWDAAWEAARAAAWDAARAAAWDATWAAAGAAAWDAAWDAAWAAARDAAGAAARDAARAATWDATWDAAGAAAWDAAWDAAGDAAWAGAAARAAARAAAWDAARDAAREAADEALAPTVVELQGSARELLDQMITLGQEDHTS